ncbi:MAG: hypothetical protein ND807_04385 [Vicinamibacterales bacterium]|nr:hypothetical protein [Vicinamibacterales bacterium]
MMFVGTIVLLALTVGLALIIARATLDLLLLLLGLRHPVLIRWHIVAFAAMVFWAWYFAPSLSAM